MVLDKTSQERAEELHVAPPVQSYIKTSKMMHIMTMIVSVLGGIFFIGKQIDSF